MPAEPLTQPVLVPIEQLRALRRLERLDAPRCHIALHRVMAAAELPCDPLGTPAQRLQPHHRRHIVRRFHHLPPQNLVLQGASRDSSLVHSLSPQASAEGAIPRNAEGAIFHGARNPKRYITHTAFAVLSRARLRE